MAEEQNPVRVAWETNAEHWDKRMAEGNEFTLRLVAPAEERLLPVRPGDRILDVACGNGVHSRRLARRGAMVLAVDISPRLLELARQRTPNELGVEYRVVDAASTEDLARLPTEFDAVVCHMAIFDMERVDLLFAAAAARLRPGAPMIISGVHPCFNSASTHLFAESFGDDGERRVMYGVRITDYNAPREFLGRAFDDQPVPHPVFHRSLSTLLSEAFHAGFVLSGLVEPTLPADGRVRDGTLCWDARFTEIPPVIVFRFQRTED